MNRRDFIKLVATVVVIPSLPDTSKATKKSPKLSIKLKYRGWNIRIDEIPSKGYCRQIYAEKGDKRGAMLFDREDKLPEIEKKFKIWLDCLIRRAA